MAEMPDVIGGEIVDSAWGNDIRDRTIQRYATVAERTTDHPSPAAGDLSFVVATGLIEVYTGSSWTTAYLRPALTTQPGIVQLSNSVNSTSQTVAATSLAVKTAYDEAASSLMARTTSTTGDLEARVAALEEKIALLEEAANG